MGYYDVLTTAWNSISGTIDEKLAILNDMTVEGPIIDVYVGEIESLLSLSGSLSQIENWIISNPSLSPTQIAARELMRTINSPHIGMIRMTNPSIYAGVRGMLDLLVSANLISLSQETALMALAKPNILWATAPNGAGLPSIVTYDHLTAAGLI